MGKKFVGLDGLKHFWTKAKTWIAGQITAEVTAKIAELVANAPEDLDTLKEISDWITEHANSAAEMNTQIIKNQDDIKLLQNKTVESCPVDVVEDGNMHAVTSNAVAKEIQDVMYSNIYIPNPTFPGISYAIPIYRVQSISKVDGVSIEGKTLQISFRLYKYVKSFSVQLSYGTTDGFIQQMSGAGRIWYVEINQNDTDYFEDNEWKIFNKSVTIPQGNPVFGVGANGCSICINSLKVV